MKAAVRVVFLLFVCLLSFGQAIRIDRAQLFSGNATKVVKKPHANTSTNVTTKPVVSPATAAAAKASLLEVFDFDNKNSTKSMNGTKSNHTRHHNGTMSNKTRPHNATKKSVNKTEVDKATAMGAVLQRVMPIAGDSVGKNATAGPTDACPSCQRMRGRPTVDYSKTPAGVSFTSGPVVVRADVEEALVRQVMSVNTGDRIGQSIMSFTKMFVCNSTELVNGVFPAEKRFKTVDFTLKGRDAPYMWTIADPTKTSDNDTAAYSYSITATPKNKAPGLLRPSIILDQNLLSNENITNSKFDFKLDNFENSYWNMSGANATHVAVVYTISDVDHEGKTHNPVAEHVSAPRAHMNVTVPMTPKVGSDHSGQETLDVTGASVGGLDITGPGYATTANGNQKPVIMTVGKDVDGSTAVYFFYERFNTSMVHDPYVTMNSNMLKSSAATVSVLAAVAMTLVAVMMGM